MSAKNGKAYINIQDGGVLELRKGGMYNGSDTYADPHLNVYAGGTLLMGKQDNTTDYGSGYNTLGLHLWDGSTIGGYGTGTIDIYHTFWGVQTATGLVNIWSQAGQELHFHRAVKPQNLHIHGGGAVSIHANGAVRNYSIETAELNFLQENVSIESLTVQGNAILSMGSAALNADTSTRSIVIGTGELTTGELRIEAGADKSLSVDNSIASLNVDSLKIQNRGDMNVSARLSSSEATITSTQMENIHLENVSISNANDLTLQYSQLSNSTIDDSTIQISEENKLVNSTVGENVSFALGESAILIMENSTISRMQESTFNQVVRNNLTLKDMVYVKNSTLQVQNDQITEGQATLNGDAMNLYRVEGVALLLDEATIEGRLIVELMGLELSSFEDIDYGIEIAGLSSATTMDLSQLSWQVQGVALEFNARYDNSGNLVLVYDRDLIPEPSTATLSLLALTALLARRRRKAA